MVNWKGCEMKQSLPNLRYYPNICLKELRKTTKNFSQINRFQSRDFNPGPPEYEAGALTTRPDHSIRLKTVRNDACEGKCTEKQERNFKYTRHL
jgi:hypothetical protein